MSSLTIAAVQDTPVFMDRDATIAHACDLIAEAAKRGARLAVFPEAFLPTYPLWAWFIPPGRTADLRALYAELHANSIAIPGPEVDRLCAAAREGDIAVAMGLNEINTEASGTSLYNTVLVIGNDGTVLGKHRKFVPTAAERLIWAQGDGSTFDVYRTPVGTLGCLICWENYMPLARHALAAWGMQILAAPTWDRGEPWLSTMRHSAKETRSYVVGCCSAVHRDDIPDRYAFKETYLPPDLEWINPGLSVIVDPDGKIIAGPAEKERTILVAEVDTAALSGPRFQLDIAGHYARPDVFDLTIHRDPRPMLRVATSEEPNGRGLGAATLDAE